MEGRDKKNEKRRFAPFVPVTKRLMDTPAWRALTPAAKVLYVSLRRRTFNDVENERCFLSDCDAAKEVGCHRNTVPSKFREWQAKGFIEANVLAHQDITTGQRKATTWILTELGHARKTATKGYEKWTPGNNYPVSRCPVNNPRGIGGPPRKKQKPTTNTVQYVHNDCAKTAVPITTIVHANHNDYEKTDNFCGEPITNTVNHLESAKEFAELPPDLQVKEDLWLCPLLHDAIACLATK